jgi:hypothetical protein
MGRWAGRRPTTDEQVEEEEEDESTHIFCTTWIELALGLTLLAFWACKSSTYLDISKRVLINSLLPSRSDYHLCIRPIALSRPQ